MDRGLRTTLGLATVVAALIVSRPNDARAETWVQGPDAYVLSVACTGIGCPAPTAIVDGRRVRIDLNDFTNNRAQLLCSHLLDRTGSAYGVMTKGHLKIAGDFFTSKGAEAHGYLKLDFEDQRLIAFAAPRQPDRMDGSIDLADVAPAFPVLRPPGARPIDFATLNTWLNHVEPNPIAGPRPYLAYGKLIGGEGEFEVDAFGIGLMEVSPKRTPRFLMRAHGEVIPTPAGSRVLVTRSGARLRILGGEGLRLHHDLTVTGVYTDAGELRVLPEP